MMDNSKCMEECKDTIRRQGVLASVEELVGKIGFEGLVAVVDELVIAGEADLIKEVVDSDVDIWYGPRCNSVLMFLQQYLERTAYEDVVAVLDAMRRMLEIPGLEQRGFFIAHYYGKYLRRKPGQYGTVCGHVLCDESLTPLIPYALSFACEQDAEKWLPRLISWTNSQKENRLKVLGVIALGQISASTIKAACHAGEVLALARKLAEDDAFVNEHGYPLFNLNHMWSSHDGLGASFAGEMDKLIESGNLKVLQAAALLEQDEMKDASSEKIGLRLKAFSKAVQQDINACGWFDSYLRNLVRIDPDRVIAFFEGLFAAKIMQIYDVGVFVESFKGLINGPVEVRDRVVTRWLKSDNPWIWKGVGKLVGTVRHEVDLGVHLDGSVALKDEDELIAIMFRGIGYLFSSYLTCTGFAISCLERMSAEGLKRVSPLFFNVWVMNYPDVMRDYLQAHKGDGKKNVIRFIRDLMRRYDSICTASKRCGKINELLPPTDDVNEFWKMRGEENREIQEAAMRQSILGLIGGPTVCMLYGKGSIVKTWTKDGEKREDRPFAQSVVQVRMPATMRYGEVELQDVIDELRYGVMSK